MAAPSSTASTAFSTSVWFLIFFLRKNAKAHTWIRNEVPIEAIKIFYTYNSVQAANKIKRAYAPYRKTSVREISSGISVQMYFGHKTGPWKSKNESSHFESQKSPHIE